MNNIWLKEVSLEDDDRYFHLLVELANYEDAYAHPVPSDFSYEDYPYFKVARVKMATNDNLPANVMPTSTFWVMDKEEPIGYATLKHKIDENKPGGHLGCCLKKDYQNRGIGSVVADNLSRIAYEDLGITELIYTSKNENIQSQKSLQKIGATFVSIHDGYHFYKVDLAKKFEGEKGKKV